MTAWTCAHGRLGPLGTLWAPLRLQEAQPQRSGRWEELQASSTHIHRASEGSLALGPGRQCRLGAAGRAALSAEALVGWWHFGTGLLGSHYSLLSQPLLHSGWSRTVPLPSPSLSGSVLMDLLCDMNTDHMGQAKGSQVLEKDRLSCHGWRKI